MTTYQELRQKHRADAYALASEYTEMLAWPADRLRRVRESRLRALVCTAQERSPWHRQRLAGIDPLSLTEDDLERIPPMTKVDLMAHWDEIVTDPRLNLDRVNDHLETLHTDRYLFDLYHAIASGGSTGTRGVFVYDWSSWALLWLLIVRTDVRKRASGPRANGKGSISANVCAGKAVHLSSAIVQTFRDPRECYRFPVTLPVAEIVAGLNGVQPTFLGGYPSALYLLANEARAGRLRISPSSVGTTAEPLLPEIRKALEGTWGVPVDNLWACSEGGVARSCGQGRGMHLADDLTIVEPVDAEGKPVPPGVRSAKIHLTNLYNHTLPLIRYEITDEMTFIDEPCPCGSSHRRIEDVQGRMDELFVYGSGIQVHPHLFRSALGCERNILEYQVRQTERGAAIAIRCASDARGAGDVDVPKLRAEIAEGLAALGLEDPDLSIVQVDHIQRLGTGKLKRFLPMRGCRATAPVVQRTVCEQLLSISPAERVSRLSKLLRSKIAAVLGVAEDEIPLDVPFGQLTAQWADPGQVYAAVQAPVEEWVGRPFRLWEFMRWPYSVGPIDSIRQLARHLADELEIPVPKAPYLDPVQDGSFHWPQPAPRPSETPKNRPAIFVLASARSGSTLLRVMLARHPALFCGPELHLLPFQSMAARHRTLSQLGYHWWENGLKETLALLDGLTDDGAAKQVQQLVQDDVSIQDVYRMLQGRIGERLLVDKSPSYTDRPAWLARAEDLFEDAKYIYLARHPCAAIESFVRMRFHWLLGKHLGFSWDENPWLFAEKCWAVNNRNAIDFLGDISPRRQHWVRYEELVTDPEAVMNGICGFLGLAFDSAVLYPYQGISTTWELGDPNLLTHRRVDPALAMAWKRKPPPHRLSPYTLDVSDELGYVLDQRFRFQEESQGIRWQAADLVRC